MSEPGTQDLERLIRTRDWERLRSELARLRPFDLAAELTRLPTTEQAIAFRLLPKDLALSTFEALDPPVQGALLSGLREDSVRELFANLTPDDRVELLDELPAKVVHRLLAQLSPHERLMTTGLLGYPPEAVGRVMSPEYVTLKATMTAAEALERVRQRGAEAETVYTLPVVAEDRRLIGITSLRRLVLADPEVSVATLMSDPIAAPALSDQESAARLLQAAGLLALPIVDAEDRLLGVFTVDDAMAVLEGADTEDAARIGGSEPLRRPYLVASVTQIARSRAVWLLVLAATGALTVLVLDAFERELATVVALTLFVPLLIGTGGNAGAQAASTVIRAIAVGEVQFRDLLRVVAREGQVGLLLGAMLSAVAFPVTTTFLTLRGDPLDDAARIALVLSLSLLGICTLAATSGAVMPVLAARVGIDPAVVSSPLITTVVDAGGLVIYLLIAKMILADMIGG
ncbi:MAG TPA: magnesium transporter [Natronosporangium sp.]|nr:magnesium transporter [Natronosporangium sp.]